MSMAAVSGDESLRSCPHTGHPHRHGTRVAYLADRCRCHHCRRANRRAEAERTRAIVMGRWEPFVDARETREHLQLLRKYGVGIDRIGALSGVPRSTIRRLLAPVDLADRSHPRRIRPDTARRLLAIDCSDILPARKSLVDAAPTYQRIAELTYDGYSPAELARKLGRTNASLRRTLARSVVTLETAQAVALLHLELHVQPSVFETPDR